MAKMFYTLTEAANKLQQSEEQIKQMVASGQLQEFRDRDRIMLKKDEVDLLAPDSLNNSIPLAESVESGSSQEVSQPPAKSNIFSDDNDPAYDLLYKHNYSPTVDSLAAASEEMIRKGEMKYPSGFKDLSYSPETNYIVNTIKSEHRLDRKILVITVALLAVYFTLLLTVK